MLKKQKKNQEKVGVNKCHNKQYPKTHHTHTYTHIHTHTYTLIYKQLTVLKPQQYGVLLLNHLMSVSKRNTQQCTRACTCL